MSTTWKYMRGFGVAILGLLFGMLSATAWAVSGAGFTTVNEGVDGPDHCKNGNPGINCNIYDDKKFVWLNGGPTVAYVGPGTYFFAVLEPGGQANPNDGTSKNLSDDYDLYTDRTFSVDASGSVSYVGPHSFDSNKIRLMPYADTGNPGGVYIMAICALRGTDPYPVDPSDCKYDAFKIQTGDNNAPKPLPLSITKTRRARTTRLSRGRSPRVWTRPSSSSSTGR